jgi:hypothetical protein
VIEASCHCGAVRLEIAAAPDCVTVCNCSICRRIGALWAYYRPDQITLIHAPGATVAYIWGDRMLALHHCGTCGCTTHWESIEEPPIDRMGVNARLMEIDLEAVPVRKNDGASY